MLRRRFFATFLALAIPICAFAQFGFYRTPAYPNAKYDDRWVFTRLRYHPSSSWNHDYPRADRHLAYIVADLSTVRVQTEASNVLDLGDPEIFRHPLVYMSEPGFWDMTDNEAANLRQYLLKGGFILFDDFETTQWGNMAAQMRRVLPEYQWITIDVTHPVFHTFFDLKKIDYHHPMYPGMVPEYRALFERNDPTARMIRWRTTTTISPNTGSGPTAAISGSIRPTRRIESASTT